MVVTTCQFQFNKLGSGITLRVVVPQNLSGGTRAAYASAAGARSLVGGASVTVTISPVNGSPVGAGPQAGTQTQTLPLNGESSLDFSFSLSSGSYDASALMQDASGNNLIQMTTKFTVPTGNYPVVLTLFSNLLVSPVVAGPLGTSSFDKPQFEPTTYDYSTLQYLGFPQTVTLTISDPKATITVTQNGVPISPSGSDYTIPTSTPAVIIVVTAADGSVSATYTYSPNGG